MPTNFLWASGTAGGVGNVGGTATGMIAPYIVLFSTELSTGSVGLATGSGTTSSANSTAGEAAGIFANASSGSGTYQGIWGDVWWKTGGSATGTALAGGANLAGWFLTSYDGVNFETPSATVSPARPPDWLITVPVSTGSSIAANTWYKSIGRSPSVLFPALNFKAYLQNNLGTGLTPGTGPIIVGALSAIQY